MRGNADGWTKRQLLPASTVARSRDLRKNAGEPERRLRGALREAIPAAKFRFQVPLGPYHADFCSHSARLIVEVDGDEHVQRADCDATRTRFLEHEGYRIIHFTNAEVMTNIDSVLAAIAAALETKKGRP